MTNEFDSQVRSEIELIGRFPIEIKTEIRYLNIRGVSKFFEVKLR